jgi:5-methylcytosine-specific restriction endonuclease McrA
MNGLDEIVKSQGNLAQADKKFAQAKRLKNALRRQRRDGKLLYEGWRYTSDWQQWRLQQLHQQNWLCACCGKVMVFGEKICLTNGDFDLQPNHPTVDHILPKSLFPNLAVNKQNLVMLCWACNQAKGSEMTIASRMRHQQLKQSFSEWSDKCKD